ncbi:MAG: alpha/beta hydrolase [Candidatus Omnitrophica bacterium]|nr:alpha/beta hydrolase [Candidatus Omnitrophota bacterium]
MSRVLVSNDHASPFIVYVPGITGTGALSNQFLQQTQQSFNLTQLHFPGHSRLTLEELADGCVNALAEQGRRKAIWMGESFGSTIALLIALRHPSAVEGLVLASGLTKMSSPSRLMMAARIWDSSPDAWRKNFLRKRLNRLARRCSGRLSKSQIDNFLINGQMDFVSWRLRLLASFDVRQQLTRIGVPTLYLGGEEDTLVDTQEEAKILRESLESVRTFLFPGCGHAILAERPEESLDILSNFLPLARRVAA